MTTCTSARVCSALLAGVLASACGSGHMAKPSGQVSFSAKTLARVTDASPAPVVCATFALQPYSLDAGGTPTLAGSPVTVSSSAATAGGTAAILGCIDNPDIHGNDWGYIVTASNFVNCATGAAISGLSPSIVTQNFPIDCTAGKDVPVDISVDVSIPVPNQAGYVDISVSVNSTVVQTGCKYADTNAAGELHFGESYLDPAGMTSPPAAHNGIVGLDSGSPRQWAGIVSGGAGVEDTFYTGQLQSGEASLIFQTFVDPCGAGAEYADDHHAQCVTLSGGMTGLATTASLADVFVSDLGWGYASASINSAGAIRLYSNVAAVNLMSATPANVVGFNGVTSQTIGPLAGATPYTFTGLFVDLSAAHQFLVTGLDSHQVPVYWSLAPSGMGGTWALGAPALLSSVSAATAECLGLFASAHGSCRRPHSCEVVRPQALGGEQCDDAFKRMLNSVGCNFLGVDQQTFCNQYWVCRPQFTAYLEAYSAANPTRSCSSRRPITACTITGPNLGNCTCPP